MMKTVDNNVVDEADDASAVSRNPVRGRVATSSITSLERSRYQNTAVRWLGACATAAFLLVRVGTATATERDDAAAEYWTEGARAYAAGDYEAARQAFLQAFALRPDAYVEQNLGEAELRSGHFVEAAKHLSEFLESSEGDEQQRMRAQKSLETALSHVARLKIQASPKPPDADVRVDGERVQVEHAIYLMPGKHSVKVTAQRYKPIERSVEVAAGSSAEVTLTFVPLVNGPERKPDILGAPPPRSAPMSTPTGPSNSYSSRTVILLSGGIATAALLGTGAYFFFKGESEQSDAEAIRSTLYSGACSEPIAARNVQSCADLRSTWNARTGDGNAGVALLVAGSVLGAATTATLVLWQPASVRKHVGIQFGRGADGYRVDLTGRF